MHVIGFPSLLERCISGIDDGRISIHLLCSSLNNLAALFSVYYHRVKILTVNIKSLERIFFVDYGKYDKIVSDIDFIRLTLIQLD